MILFSRFELSRKVSTFCRIKSTGWDVEVISWWDLCNELSINGVRSAQFYATTIQSQVEGEVVGGSANKHHICKKEIKWETKFKSVSFILKIEIIRPSVDTSLFCVSLWVHIINILATCTTCTKVHVIRSKNFLKSTIFSHKTDKCLVSLRNADCDNTWGSMIGTWFKALKNSQKNV